MEEGTIFFVEIILKQQQKNNEIVIAIFLVYQLGRRKTSSSFSSWWFQLNCMRHMHQIGLLGPKDDSNCPQPQKNMKPPQGGPLAVPVIDRGMTPPYKWPKINGCHWSEKTP